MSMKIPCNFQVRTTRSCATVRTGLWRRPDALQCLEALASKTSGRQGNTVRMIGQAFPISHGVGFQSTTWQLVTDLGSLCKTSGRRGNLSGRYPAFQNIPGFLYKRGNELQWRPSGRSAKPSGRGPVMGRIALFWKGGRRRLSGGG
jgi:hypothetical protein